jgi:hypothetical protein
MPWMKTATVQQLNRWGRLADGEQQRLDFPGLLDRARREEQDNSSAKVHARRVCGRDERASRCAR